MDWDPEPSGGSANVSPETARTTTAESVISNGSLAEKYYESLFEQLKHLTFARFADLMRFYFRSQLLGRSWCLARNAIYCRHSSTAVALPLNPTRKKPGPVAGLNNPAWPREWPRLRTLDE
jgi:hypothetical protein